jgi:hypothetical protein
MIVESPMRSPHNPDYYYVMSSGTCVAYILFAPEQSRFKDYMQPAAVIVLSRVVRINPSHMSADVPRDTSGSKSG